MVLKVSAMQAQRGFPALVYTIVFCAPVCCNGRGFPPGSRYFLLPCTWECNVSSSFVEEKKKKKRQKLYFHTAEAVFAFNEVHLILGFWHRLATGQKGYRLPPCTSQKAQYFRVCFLVLLPSTGIHPCWRAGSMCSVSAVQSRPVDSSSALLLTAQPECCWPQSTPKR